MTEHEDYEAELRAIDAAEVWFGLKNGDVWPANGENMTYKYDAATYNEFYDINLWTAAQPAKLVGGSIPIPLGGLVANIRLFLRRPRWSKGNIFNWTANPATNRLFTWFDKQISTINPVAGLFNHFVEPTPFLDLARRNAPKRQQRLGTWSVEWAGQTVVGGE